MIPSGERLICIDSLLINSIAERKYPSDVVDLFISGRTSGSIDVDETFGERRKTIKPAKDKRTRAPIMASHFFVMFINNLPLSHRLYNSIECANR